MRILQWRTLGFTALVSADALAHLRIACLGQSGTSLAHLRIGCPGECEYSVGALLGWMPRGLRYDVVCGRSVASELFREVRVCVANARASFPIVVDDDHQEITVWMFINSPVRLHDDRTVACGCTKFAHALFSGISCNCLRASSAPGSDMSAKLSS